MEVIIRRIRYSPIYSEINSGEKILVKIISHVDYAVVTSDEMNTVVRGYFDNTGRINEEEAKEILNKKYNIMETKFERVDRKNNHTIFTGIQHATEGWKPADGTPEMFDRVVYLGEDIKDGDIFACYDSCGQIIIAKGVKGNEF